MNGGFGRDAELRVGDARASDVADFEPRVPHEPGGERIGGAGHERRRGPRRVY